MKILFELVVQDAGIATKLDLLRSNLREIQKELKGVDQDSKAFESLSQEATQTRVEIAQLVEQQKALKQEFAAAKFPSDSLAGLRLEYSRLIGEIKNLTKAERESAQGQELIKNAKSLKDEINGIEQSVGNFTGSVGNYKNSIVSAANAVGIFGGTLGEQANILTTVVGLFDQAIDAAAGFGQTIKQGAQNFRENVNGFKEYLVNSKKVSEANKEVADTTEAVGDAVENTAEQGQAAGKALTEGSKGAKLFSAAGSVLKTVLASIGIGLIIALVVGLIGVFQRFAPVVDFIEQAVAGLSAAFDVLVSRVAKLVSAFGKLFEGDFSGAFDEASDAVSGVGEQMVKAALAAAGLKKEIQELEDAQKDFTLTTAKAEAAVAKLSVALKDRTKSDGERLKIAAQITKIETQNLAEKTALIDRELDIERRKLLLTGQISEEQANQIAQGNFDLARQLEDEYKLTADQADRIRELLVERVRAEGESATLLERVQSRKNLILEEATNRQKAAADKAQKIADDQNKALEAQAARLRDLAKSIRELDAQTLTSDFDKRETEIENKRLEALDKVAQAREVLKKKIAAQGGILTPADEEEGRLISEQTASIVAAYQLQFDEVRQARQEAVDRQKQELADLSLEVQRLADQNAQKLAEAQVEILNTDFAQQNAKLLTTLSERKLALTKELEEGVISQKQFDEAFSAEQQTFNERSLALEIDRATRVKQVAEELAQSRIDAARSELAVRLQVIEETTREEIRAAKEQAVQTGDDPSVRIAEIRKKAAEDRAAAELEYKDAVRQTVAETEALQLDAIDRVNEADQKAHDEKLRRLKEEEDQRKKLRDAAVDAASSIAGAVFDIQKNQIDKETEAKTQALDEETQRRREQAGNNADLLAKIDADYAKKKERIEKEAAQKRKKVAIIEAVINTALAITKALPNLILAALAAVAGAAQIAVISSQKFAKGGALQFKAGRFGGRPHSQGGTKGYFDDGTRVEVEEDEVFVILNKRASRKINQLSEFNYLHGGRKFESGGSLDFTPQVDRPGESSGVHLTVYTEASFSEDQIDQFATTVADKTSTKTQNAVVAGLDERNRVAERQLALDSSREV